MLDYKFERGDIDTDRVVFVLMLDKEKKKERILIGTDFSIESTLRYGKSIEEVMLDITRPLGTLLLDYEKEFASDWRVNCRIPLYIALTSFGVKIVREHEKQGADYLKEKYKEDNPFGVYISYRIWNEYLITRMKRDRKVGGEVFRKRTDDLFGVFPEPNEIFEHRQKPYEHKTKYKFFGGTPEIHNKLTLWYPDDDMDRECVVAYETFYPLMTYYQKRLKEWGLVFRRCLVCDRFFLAGSLHYNLCSEKCRKVRRSENKKDFDRQAKDNNYDVVYKNETQNWRNKINKAKKTPDFPEEKLLEMENAFKEFKKEALSKKKAVKAGKMPVREFMDWMYGESRVIEGFLE